MKHGVSVSQCIKVPKYIKTSDYFNMERELCSLGLYNVKGGNLPELMLSASTCKYSCHFACWLA